jgi:hypothetical protein
MKGNGGGKETQNQGCIKMKLKKGQDIQFYKHNL